jgi:hypothetical protein
MQGQNGRQLSITIQSRSCVCIWFQKRGAVAAGGAAIDEAVDTGERIAGLGEKVVEVHGLETIEIIEDLLVEGMVFFEEAAPAAGGAMSVAELVAAFGDATALLTIGADVDAFFDHEGSSGQ